MEKSLRWKANIIYEEDDQEKDWVLVDGKATDITGIGNSNVAITVVNTTNASSILNARVEFIYYDENDKEIIRKYVNVCRCLLCGCDNLEFWPEPCGCENLTITNITMCTCNNFTLEKTSLDWDWNNTDVKEISFTADTCISDITAPTSEHFNVVIEGNAVKVSPKESNHGAEINETITITYKAAGVEQPCKASIHAKHKEMICNCNNLPEEKIKIEKSWENNNQ